MSSSPASIKASSHSGGNITGGRVEASPLIYGKKLEYLKQMNPKLTRVALLWNSAATAARAYLKATEDGTRQLGLQLQSVEVRKPEDLDGAFAAISRRRAEGVVVVADPVTFSARARIAQSAARHAVPVVAPRREFADAGALLSYGPDPVERWRRAAFYVDRLLKGAKSAELPLEQPSTFELVINRKVAKALGLTIPSSSWRKRTR
jgi:putative tryptophan/tyrosine transport system substrate-binding protein